jgi:hypothetical protein
LRKLVVAILAVGIVAGPSLLLAFRPPGPSQEEIAQRLKARAEVEHSVKCGQDHISGTTAYVQCMALFAARTQGALQAQPRAKGLVASVVAGVVMLVAFVSMMLVFYGFWALGTWMGLQ